MAEYNIMNLVTKKILEINPIYSRYKDSYDVALIDEMLENIEISTPILKIVRDTVGRVLTVEKTIDDVDEKQFEEIIKRYEHIENIKKFVERTCYTMYYGFTVHEKIYDFDENNNLYLKSLEYIPREYILFDNGVYKVRTITGNIEIDENKFIISTYDEDINHPLGQSLFRYGLFQAYNDLMTLEDQIRGLQEKYGDTIVVFPYIDSEGETEEGIAKINERIEQMKDLQGGDVLAVPVPRDAMGNVNMKDNVIFISLDDLKIDMHITLTDRLENKINDFLMGADYSSSESATGSYARDKVQENEKTKIVDYTSDFICDELDKILLFDSMLYNYNPDDYEFKLNIERSLTDIYSMEKLEAEKDKAKAESKIKISEGVNSSIESIKNLSRNMGYESGTPSEEMINEISMIYGIDKNIVSKIIQNSYLEFEKKKSIKERKEQVKQNSENLLKIVEEHYNKFSNDISQQVLDQVEKATSYKSFEEFFIKIPSLLEDMILIFLLGINNEIEMDFEPYTSEFEEQDEYFDPLNIEFNGAVDEMLKRHPEIQEYIDISYEEIIRELGNVRELTQETLRVKLLNSIYGSFEAGETFEEWKEMIFSTGKFKPDDVYFHTVYRMNIFNAYNAGLYKQQERNISYKPYGLFDAVGDERTTEVCNQNNGLIFPLNDPYWDTYYPPLHFNCRSERIALSIEDLQNEGIDTATIGQYKLGGIVAPQEDFGGYPLNPAELEKQIRIKKDEAYNMFQRLDEVYRG